MYFYLQIFYLHSPEKLEAIGEKIQVLHNEKLQNYKRIKIPCFVGVLKQMLDNYFTGIIQKSHERLG